MDQSRSNEPRFPMRRYTLLGATAWCLVLAVSLAWNLHLKDRHLQALAIDKARTHIEKDIAFRSWAAGHGGVYVPVDERTPPSPWLGHIPDRDITTPSGKRLTLMNPAYMMRQLNEESATALASGHITSLKVLRPQNAPDSWEKEALLTFEAGKRQVVEISAVDGRPYLRMMLPFHTEGKCLKCHGHQGYKVGDIRGGISTSVALEPYARMMRQARQRLVFSHGLIWLLGMGMIGLTGRQGEKRLREGERWQEHLRQVNRRLKMLSECNQTLIHSTREAKLLTAICRKIVEIGGYRLAWVGYAQKGPEKAVLPVAQAGFEAGYLEKLNLSWSDSERGRGPVGTAIRTEKPCIVRNITTDPNFAPWRREALERGYHSAVALPLTLEAEVIGALTIYAAAAGAFDEEEMQLLRELADDLSFGIATLRTRAVKRQAEEEIRHLNDDLEKRVIERTAQLEAANRELEAFAYSVSHDLRAPLRAIDGFSQALLEDYQEVVDSQGQDYLRRVRAATERMGQLIDDILQLSRISRRPVRAEPVDLSALARDVAAELSQSEPQRRVRWTIEDDLGATGDAHLLRVVLANLLGNAWKYTSRRDAPVIEFGRLRQEPESVYFVRDNGAGFDMAYADKLFLTFHRLHSAEEFPGTGIGLALVQRVIDHHGGRVWARGEVGQGATFFFTLGRVQPVN